jgi:hypothetical protein
MFSTLSPPVQGCFILHTNRDLLHTEQVDEAGMLAGLPLDLTGLVVTFRNGLIMARSPRQPKKQ